MSYRSALSIPDFRALWLAQVSSRIGDAVHEVALLWVIYSVTNDPQLVSITLIASYLPSLVLEMTGGVLADRANRKWIMIITDVVRGVIVLAIPLIGESKLLVPVVVTVAFLTGACDSIDGPARRSIIPSLVPEEELDSANSLSSFTATFSQTLFLLGGIIIAFSGSFYAFYIDAASFLLSALLLARISTEAGRPGDQDRSSTEITQNTFISSLKEATSTLIEDTKIIFTYVKKHSILVNILLLGALIQMVFAPLSVLMPVYAPKLPAEQLGIPSSVIFGALYSIFFTGMSIGAILVNYKQNILHSHRGTIIITSILLLGTTVGLIGALNPAKVLQAVVIMTALFIAGMSYSGVNVAVATMRHSLVPDDHLARFSSLDATFTTVALLIGLGVSGFVVDTIGPRMTFGVIGVGLFVLGLGFATQPIAKAQGDLEVRPTDEDHSSSTQ